MFPDTTYDAFVGMLIGAFIIFVGTICIIVYALRRLK